MESLQTDDSFDDREELERSEKHWFELDIKKHFKTRKDAALYLINKSQKKKLHWVEAWFISDVIEHPRRLWISKGRTKFTKKEYRPLWFYQMTVEKGLSNTEAISKIAAIEGEETGEYPDESSIRESIGLKK